MKSTVEETSSTPIHSLILERKLAFANLVRAYLRFNVSDALKINVIESEDRDVFISINDKTYKFDVNDYTGATTNYIFYNTSSGRFVIEGNGVSKVYKLDVDLYDE